MRNTPFRMYLECSTGLLSAGTFRPPAAVVLLCPCLASHRCVPCAQPCHVRARVGMDSPPRHGAETRALGTSAGRALRAPYSGTVCCRAQLKAHACCASRSPTSTYSPPSRRPYDLTSLRCSPADAIDRYGPLRRRNDPRSRIALCCCYYAHLCPSGYFNHSVELL